MIQQLLHTIPPHFITIIIEYTKQSMKYCKKWKGNEEISLQSKLIYYLVMIYRQLIKNTYLNIKSKPFRSYLIHFYRENIDNYLSDQELIAWQNILAEIAHQQQLQHPPRKQKFIFQNCLFNYKGFQFSPEKLYHLNPTLLEELMHIFMRVQIHYIHSIDSKKENPPYRIISILNTKQSPRLLHEYYINLPEQKLGSRLIRIPRIGNWARLFD